MMWDPFNHYILVNHYLVKAMAFPVVMYGCEIWTIKEAEHRRIDAFELWCWRRLMRVPWTERRSNKSILKEISPEYSLEGLMLKLKLKLQYFGHLIWRTDSLEKTLILGKTEGRRRRGWLRMRWLDGITDWPQEMVKNRETWCVAVPGAARSQTRPSDWTTSLALYLLCPCFVKKLFCTMCSVVSHSLWPHGL